jgi:predicted negative regulator of RcsB-dependent stress response
LEDYLSEKEQLEAVRQWFKDNGAWILIALAIPFAVFGGKAQYQRWQDGRSQGAQMRYAQVLDALGHGDRSGARKLADTMRAEQGKSPYPDQADLALARAAAEAEDLPETESLLRRVIERGRDEEIRLMARLRLARVERAQGKADAALATLAGAEPKGFAALYAEVKGDCLLDKGDRAGAIAAYQEALKLGGKGTIDQELVGYKLADLGGSAAKDAGAATTPKAAP